MAISPFTYEKLALEDRFAGRDEEKKRITSNIFQKNNTVLLSPRKWGKTTLVKQIFHELRNYSYYSFAYIDLFRIRDEQEFFEVYCGHIIESLSENLEDSVKIAQILSETIGPKLTIGMGSKGVSLGLQFARKYTEELFELAQKAAEYKNKTLIICLDEFQNCDSFPRCDEFLKSFYAISSNHTNVIYILSGNDRQLMTPWFDDKIGVMPQFGDVFYLPKIDSYSFAIHLMHRFSSNGKTISKDRADELIATVENHPYYVEHLCDVIWQLTEGSVTEKHIAEGVEILVNKNTLMFQKEFGHLTKLQINVLKALNDGIRVGFTSKDVIRSYNLNSSATTLRAITALEKKELIDRFEEQVHFVDPVFKNFLKKVWEPKTNEEYA